jgi:non-canonical purine NTP pyrophosphatase (RdgB/HAM1 family)
MYFLSWNAHKFAEMRLLLPELEQVDIHLPEIQSLDPKEVIQHKLEAGIAQLPGKKLIVEDTSLVISSRWGLPGPFIKRFLQTVKDVGIWQMVKNFPDKKAFGRSMIGYFDGENLHFFEWIVHGQIVEPIVSSPFGRDALFLPDGYDKTFGHMTMEEKNKISHRANALRKFMEFLESH